MILTWLYFNCGSFCQGRKAWNIVDLQKTHDLLRAEGGGIHKSNSISPSLFSLFRIHWEYMTAHPVFLTSHRKPYSKDANILIASQRCYSTGPQGILKPLGWAKVAWGRGGERQEWFPGFLRASWKSHIPLLKEKSKPSVLGSNLAAHFVKLSHTGQKHIAFRLLNWMLQQRALAQCKSILGPWVGVRQNHANPTHIHSSGVYRATALCQALRSALVHKYLQILVLRDPTVWWKLFQHR